MTRTGSLPPPTRAGRLEPWTLTASGSPSSAPTGTADQAQASRRHTKDQHVGCCKARSCARVRCNRHGRSTPVHESRLRASSARANAVLPGASGLTPNMIARHGETLLPIGHTAMANRGATCFAALPSDVPEAVARRTIESRSADCADLLPVGTPHGQRGNSVGSAWNAVEIGGK